MTEWNPNTDPALSSWASITNRTGFFEFQKKLLENFFSSKWFVEKKNVKHSAYKYWMFCNKIINQNGFKYETRKQDLPLLGEILLNTFFLTKITDNQISTLKLGNFDFYGDDDVQKKIITRIHDEEQFGDLMTELFIGAHHQINNHNVTPLEVEGYPDLFVELKNRNIIYECKKLHTITSGRISKIIRKANNQIKSIDRQGYGVLIIDASLLVGIRQTHDDNIPAIIENTKKFIKNAITGEKNRSIRSVIITWDDYQLRGEDSLKTLVAFRRRTQKLIHSMHQGFSLDDLFNGFTATYTIHWQ